MLLRSCLLALCLLLKVEAPLAAATVELPLFLRAQILQNALQESLTPGPDRKASLYRKDSYNFFHIADPQLTLRNGEAHFRCNIAAGVGFESLGVLPSAVYWNGFIEMELMLYVDDRWHLRYRIKNSAIYDEKGVQAVLTSFVWNLSRRFLYPILENFSLDLSLPRKEILELLRNSVAPEDLATLEATLNTIAMGKLRADSNGITVPLLLTVAAEQTPHSLPAQQPLTLAEIEGLNHLFEPLDAFLVFVVKSAGADFSDPQLRSQLFDLLITNRYRLLAILAGESQVESADPLRSLFIEVWQQLRAIIESSSGQAVQTQEQLLRYMTFVNAGDALLVLDAAAPQLGMHITTDGLRRLARMLQPGYKDDPLHFDWEVDPALRNLLNFLPEPLPSPATPTLGALLLGLLVGTAHADETVPLTLAEVSNRLNGWVPTGPELEEYGFLLAQLLRNAGQAQLKNAGLTSEYGLIYQQLVPATALIESCWRQFVRTGDQVTCLRSKSGSLGIMQINQHVWRGFYDLDRLKWDTAYNIRAGAQILMRYVKDYAIPYANRSGDLNHIPRAAYSVYNAGPRAVGRFNKPNASTREQRVDQRLWTFYQGIATDRRAVDLSICGVKITTAP